VSLITRRSRRLLQPDHERALALLADSLKGVPEAVMTVGHGFTVEQLAELVHAGLATQDVRRVTQTGPNPLNVTRRVITDVGWRALAGRRARSCLTQPSAARSPCLPPYPKARQRKRWCSDSATHPR